MAISKTARTLLASQSLAAATAVNATELNLSTTGGGLASVKLTNGASAPTTAPIVKFYTGESTGTKRLYWQASGDTVNNSVTEINCRFPKEVMFANITITNGATNAITVESYAQEFTSA